jgi:hypothetical protein
MIAISVSVITAETAATVSATAARHGATRSWWYLRYDLEQGRKEALRPFAAESATRARRRSECGAQEFRTCNKTLLRFAKGLQPPGAAGNFVGHVIFGWSARISKAFRWYGFGGACP